MERAAGLVAISLFLEIVALGAEEIEKWSRRKYTHLEVPHRVTESLAGARRSRYEVPADEGLLVTKVPALDLREWPFGNARACKREVVLIPDVEQKTENIALVGAERDLLVEKDRVLGFVPQGHFLRGVVGGKLPVSDEEIDGVECVGEKLPGLEWGHGSLPRSELRSFF